MGTGSIQNGDNNLPIGKEYWKQQAEREQKADNTPWKSPTGEDYVPVGKEKFELSGHKLQASYYDNDEDGKIDEVSVVDVGKGIELDGMTRKKYTPEEFKQKFGESNQSKQFGL